MKSPPKILRRHPNIICALGKESSFRNFAFRFLYSFVPLRLRERYLHTTRLLDIVIPSGKPNAGIHPHWTTKVFVDFPIKLGHDGAYPSEVVIAVSTPSAAWVPLLIRMFFAPKGQYFLAQGNVLGPIRPLIQALKGRHIIGCSSISDIIVEKQYTYD